MKGENRPSPATSERRGLATETIPRSPETIVGGEHGDSEPQNRAPVPKKPSLVPGSDGEHRLQEKYGTKDRALAFI